MDSRELVIWITSCIICIIVICVCLPYAIWRERKKKRQSRLNKMDSYSFIPSGLEADRTKYLRDRLADALKSCKEGNLRAAAYHVQRAWVVMPREGIGPVGPSVAEMKIKDQWKEFCAMLKLAAQLPQDKNPQELMQKCLESAIRFCDMSINKTNNKEQH
jgi:hypothetical protein